MTHRAETIVDTVTTLLTGLTTTGSRVFRGRAIPVDVSQGPALLVFMGPDAIVNRLNFDKIDSLLSVYIEAYVKQNDAPDTVLNTIREEINIAMQADYTLGLGNGFVINTIENDTLEPVLSHETEKNTAVQRFQYEVHYRRTRTDPSQG